MLLHQIVGALTQQRERAQRNEGLVLDVFRRQHGLGGQSVAFRHGDHQPHVGELARANARKINGQRRQAQVELLARHPQPHIHARAHLQRYPNTRMAARELRDGAGRDAIGEVGLRQDAQPGVLLIADGIGNARHLFKTRQDMPGAVVEAQALLSGNQAASLAQKQRKPHFFFQRRNQAADLGLGTVDAARGLGHASGFQDSAQRLQTVQSHREKPGSRDNTHAHGKPACRRFS
jgi:hypothetical protein